MEESKVIFITNIPNQYRIPLFNELNRQLLEKGIRLFVIFGALGYDKRKTIVDLTECEFEYKILKSKILNRIEKKTGFFFYSGLIRTIKALNPSKIIVTGFALSTMKLLLYNKFRNNSYYIFSGSANPANAKPNFFRELQRKILIKKAKGFVAYSTVAKRYITERGGKPSTITVMGNTVDTRFFKEKTEGLRKELEGTETKHLLYIGYVTPRKKVEEFVYLVKELLKLRNDFVLDIIGDGESMEGLKKLIRENKLENYFKIHGFKQKEELPHYMAQSQCFLFQTGFDIWGLVLNEAMAAGLPCLASINAGATGDLINEGVTGFKVNFENHEYVAAKIDWLLNNPLESKKIGNQATSFISMNYGLSNAASNVIKAIGF